MMLILMAMIVLMTNLRANSTTRRVNCKQYLEKIDKPMGEFNNRAGELPVASEPVNLNKTP